MPDDLEIYLFQLLGSQEVFEVEAEDSSEAFRRCLREKAWPVERVVYMGTKEKS